MKDATGDRNLIMSLRLDRKTREMLDFLSEEVNLSSASIIRAGVKLMYDGYVETVDRERTLEDRLARVERRLGLSGAPLPPGRPPVPRPPIVTRRDH